MLKKHTLMATSFIGLFVLCVSAQTAEITVAFALERAINSGKWTEEQFKQAAGLLKHDDLFVRALADFAVSEVVGQKNNGQTVVWTVEQLKNEPWFTTWSTTAHEQKIVYEFSNRRRTAENIGRENICGRI